MTAERIAPKYEAFYRNGVNETMYTYWARSTYAKREIERESERGKVGNREREALFGEHWKDMRV